MGVKTAMWYHRAKLELILDKISLYYAILLIGLAFFEYMVGYSFFATITLLLGVLMALIQYSHLKYTKYESKIKKELTDGNKKKK